MMKINQLNEVIGLLRWLAPSKLASLGIFNAIGRVRDVVLFSQ